MGASLYYHDEFSHVLPTNNYFIENIYPSIDKVRTDQDVFYHETILNRPFRVSMSAFLQVHTPQMNKLYKLIETLAGIDDGHKHKDIVFLDICSGIGTVGISIAQNA